MFRLCQLSKRQALYQAQQTFKKAFSQNYQYQLCSYFSKSKDFKHKQTIEILSSTAFSFSSFESLDKSHYFTDLSLAKNKSRQDLNEQTKLLEKYLSCKDLTSLSAQEITSILGTFNDLAFAVQSENQTEKALSYLKEGAEFAEKTDSLRTLQAAQIFHAMGMIYLHVHQNQLENAEEAFKQTEEICKDLPYYEDPVKYLSLQNKEALGRLYYRQGKVDLALSHYNEILEEKLFILEAKLEPFLISVYQELGQIYAEQNDKEKAIEAWREGLGFAVRLNGELSANAEYFNGNIARCFFEMEDLNSALFYTKNALNASIKVYSKNSSEASWNHSLMGQINLKKGDFFAALESYNQAIKSLENLEDPPKVQLGDTYSLLAKAQFFLDLEDEAPVSFEKGIKLLIEHHGENSLQIAEYYFEWANVLRQNETKFSEAREYYTKALEIFKTLEPVNKLVLSDIYGFLGEIIFFEGNLDESLESWKKSERLFLEVSDDLARHEIICSFIGGLYLRKEDFDKSMEYFEKTIEISKQRNSTQDESLGTHYWNLGRVYENKNMPEKAVVAYLEGLTCDRRLFGKDHEYTKESAMRVVEVYEKLDRTEDAENLKKEYQLD